MAKTVEVPIPLDPETAATLTDAESRAAAGRLLSRILRPRQDDPLIDAMDRFGTETQANGMTPEILNKELTAHKIERRH
jgi:hypothetical protein